MTPVTNLRLLLYYPFTSDARENLAIGETMLAEMTGKVLVLREMEPFSETLKKLRGTLVSQQELAAKSGMTVSTISKLERGTNQPSRKTIIRLAVALSVPQDELLKMAGLDKADSPRVAVRVPRDVYERALPFAEAQGIDGEAFVSAAVEAMTRMLGTPQDVKDSQKTAGRIGAKINRKAAKKDE